MNDSKMTLGQAIDQIISALEAIEEGSRTTAISAACTHLDLKMPSIVRQGSQGQPSSNVETANHSSDHTQERRLDIRTLKEEKNPDSAKQMACIVAYYLEEMAPEGERKSTVSTQDIEKYFKQAHFKLPKKVAQILVDAKRSGYFESPAHGEYKLNAVGYNLVVHGLPTKKSS